MPALEKKDLKQRAVLWRAIGPNKYGSQKVDEPEEIWVRWVWQQGRDNGDAQVVVSDSSIPLYSRMWLADDHRRSSANAVEQWYGTGSAGDDTFILQVISIDNGTDIKNRPSNERTELALTFWRDEPSPEG